MSNSDLFRKKLQEEETLKAFAQFAEGKEPQNDEEKVALYVDFAATLGLELAPEEVSMMFAVNRELDDDELDDIAGGRTVLFDIDTGRWRYSDELGSYRGKSILGGCHSTLMIQKCTATVENGSMCWSDDACVIASSKYDKMVRGSNWGLSWPSETEESSFDKGDTQVYNG